MRHDRGIGEPGGFRVLRAPFLRNHPRARDREVTRLPQSRKIVFALPSSHRTVAPMSSEKQTLESPTVPDPDSGIRNPRAHRRSGRSVPHVEHLKEAPEQMVRLSKQADDLNATDFDCARRLAEVREIVRSRSRRGSCKFEGCKKECSALLFMSFDAQPQKVEPEPDRKKRPRIEKRIRDGDPRCNEGEKAKRTDAAVFDEAGFRKRQFGERTGKKRMGHGSLRWAVRSIDSEASAVRSRCGKCRFAPRPIPKSSEISI